MIHDQRVEFTVLHSVCALHPVCALRHSGQNLATMNFSLIGKLVSRILSTLYQSVQNHPYNNWTECTAKNTHSYLIEFILLTIMLMLYCIITTSL